MTKLRRVLSTGTVLVLLLGLMAVPASAAATASAVLTSGDILSGQPSTVSIDVTNTGSGGGLLGTPASSINSLSIEVPNHLFTDDTTAVAPIGWGAEFDPEIGFIYAWAMGSEYEIGPGATLAFGWTGTAAQTADDTTVSVPVFVSDDNGGTLTSAGTPALTSRILDIVSGTLLKPATATNPDPTQVTARQDTAAFTATVVNRGFEARMVTVGVTRIAGSSTVTTAAQARFIAPNAQASVVIPAEFGGEGVVSVKVVATSERSAAIPRELAPITVQRAFDATYVPESLTPYAAVQGGHQSFSVRVDKVGVQAASVEATFAFSNGTQSYSSTGTFEFQDATRTNVEMQFPSALIDPAFPNETLLPTITASGIDGNGATVFDLLGPDPLTLDRDLPIVDLFADVGPTEVTGTQPAAGSGRNIAFTGDVWLTPAREARCTDCMLGGDGTLHVLSANGDQLAAMSFPLSIDEGVISGNPVAFTFPAGAAEAYATVPVLKVTQRGNNGQTARFPVDIIAPEIIDAVSQRGAEADSVLVTLSEVVDGSGSETVDWAVDDNIVTNAEQINGTQFVLTLANRLNRNATPFMTYQRPPVGEPIIDRVALRLADLTRTVRDGIKPLAPVLTQVQQLPLQDGAFWTNRQRPEIGVSNLAVGDLLRLVWDRNDNGRFDAGDVELTPQDGHTITAPTQTVTPSADLDPSQLEESHDLLAMAFDAAGNRSDLDVEILSYDVVGAAIASFSVSETSGNEVTVVFTEPVPRGRDAAFDWTVFADQGGTQAYRTVTAVTYVSPTERLLTVSSSSYDPAAGAILRARFKYRGAPSDRYEDRATNEVANDESANRV